MPKRKNQENIRTKHVLVQNNNVLRFNKKIGPYGFVKGTVKGVNSKESKDDQLSLYKLDLHTLWEMIKNIGRTT